MILCILLILIVLTIIFMIMNVILWDSYVVEMLGIISYIMVIITIIIGFIFGFVNYPKSEGIHQGIITAVDQEGLIFNHYKIYLKSSGYTNQSDETEYCAYLSEYELVDKIKENIGKQVKLKYGHDGGQIGITSCGTYHVKSFELVEETK